MKAKSLVLIMIALGCGLVASIGISQVVMDRGGEPVKEERIPILVAMTDIDIGDALNEQNIKLEPWPEDRIPEGAITDPKEIADQTPKSRLYAGEPILTRKLMGGGQSTETIPPGYRVFPIKVSSDMVTQLIQPGDRVDILVFLRRNNEIRSTLTKTVLHDVRIYAVNQQTERIDDVEGNKMNAKTVSVLVKPKQVELLTVASELGKLKMSLRRHNDTTDNELSSRGGTGIDDLLNGSSQGADERRPKINMSPKTDALKDMLDNLRKSRGQQTASVAASKKMVILGPDGPARVYEFDAKDNVSKTVSLNGSGGGSSTPSGPPLPSFIRNKKNEDNKNDSSGQSSETSGEKK